MKKSILATLCSSVVVLTACQNGGDTRVNEQPKTSKIWPEIKSGLPQNDALEARIKALLETMTLEQKVAQMIQPEIRDITVEDMRRYGFGSYLNGGGSFPNGNKHSTPADWIALAEAMYQASVDDSLDGSTIPTMWGTDAVHGHNNVIGATLFPHNIGLGATNNPALIEEIARITAAEVMVTGIDWVFAPTVATVRDDRWGRTYEGYSEDPEIVKTYSSAIVKGLQGAVDGDFLSDKRVISTVKHFVGDGGTIDGDDQGNNIADEQTLFDIHAQGYVGGLSAGSQTVMASFNSWHGDKIHGNKYLLTDVLKTTMKFDGFVVGDWNGHGQVAGCSNESCPQAINAGLDVFMAPTPTWKPLFENTIAQVKSGEIPQSRIDDAVTRILRVKFRAGLFDKPSPKARPLSGKTELIGSEAHRRVAQQAVRESLVLLKNKDNTLPLSPRLNVLVAGDGADNIGKQSGGWTITWQGTNNSNDEFPGGTSIFDGIKTQVEQAGGAVTLSENGEFSQKPDVAIVVFGEEPYAEGHGDVDNLAFERGNQQSLALLKKLKQQGIKVVSVFLSGRPMWVNAELNQSDAFVAAWLPGSEGKSVAEVLFTDANGAVQHDFSGKLSFSWPKHANQTQVNRFDAEYDPLLPYGFGLAYGDKNVLNDDLSETNDVAVTAVAQLALFDKAFQLPWIASIQAGDQNKALTSSTVSLSSLDYRTVDRHVQEDSFMLSFKGEKNAKLQLFAPFREDFRAYSEQNAAIELELKVIKAPTKPVLLSMQCEGDCGASVDISALLSEQGATSWHTLNLPLSCFVEQSIDMSKITAPFVLETSGEFEVQIHKILVSVADSQQQQSCPSS